MDAYPANSYHFAHASVNLVELSGPNGPDSGMTASSSDRLSVWTGSGAEHLRPAIAADPAFDVHAAPHRAFPDGELCVRAPSDVESRRVVVLQSTGPPQHRNLTELYQLVEVAVEGGAREVACAVPYLAYGRQDRRTAPGEPASLEIVGRTLAMLGASTLATVDAHGPRGLHALPLATANLEATAAVVRYVRTLGEDATDLLIVAPDVGRRERARQVAATVGSPWVALTKHRDAEGRTRYADLAAPTPRALAAVVIDDVCSSGSTLLAVSQYLAQLGCRAMDVVVTHLLGGADALVARAALPVSLTAANTVAGPRASLDIAPLLLDWMRAGARAGVALEESFAGARPSTCSPP